ncbi:MULTISPECIES: hypothetical protein [Phyllobacteriaceae]|jgi:hypothetical protein|uniref:Uncharacterized protein n=1 Tax=Mesorhizobium hungaricum TaxID=1566387 RepID=A0A1C2DD36_9HYPH|nr:MULTISPECIES: hypothetical protein [Mesorhizobium]MBN9235143.1 hypothetical protein [Mesorhizobium sp.]OCX12659.1 hypothetical protein QV13_23975 [Mesorhizobium hungaricum]
MKPIFRRRRHDDAVRYVTYVMWLVGYSQRSIAFALGMRTKQVAGIIENSEYRARSSMSDEDRTAKLSELEAIRLDDAGAKLDGGILDRIGFTARPLDRRQSRASLKRKVRGRAG